MLRPLLYLPGCEACTIKGYVLTIGKSHALGEFCLSKRKDPGRASPPAVEAAPLAPRVSGSGLGLDGASSQTRPVETGVLSNRRERSEGAPPCRA